MSTLEICLSSGMFSDADDIGRCVNAQLGGKDELRLDEQFEAGGRRV